MPKREEKLKVWPKRSEITLNSKHQTTPTNASNWKLSHFSSRGRHEGLARGKLGNAYYWGAQSPQPAPSAGVAKKEFEAAPGLEENQDDDTTPLSFPPFPHILSPIDLRRKERFLGGRGGWEAGGPSALFTWSQRRGQAGRVRERVGDLGRLRLPAQPELEFPGCLWELLPADHSLPQRPGEKRQTASLSGKYSRRPSFIIRRTGKREVTSLPTVALPNVSPAPTVGTFVFLLSEPASVGTVSEGTTGNRRIGRAGRNGELCWATLLPAASWRLETPR